MEKKIAPSLLASDFSDLTAVVNKCESSGLEILHLDIMDGHFVPNITFGPPIISKLRPKTKMLFDCHLMIENPDNYIEDFYKAGAEWISVHVEACNHLHRSLSLIKSFGLKAGAVLNPITPMSYAYEAAEYCDFILLMSVNPGFGGQNFIESFYKRCYDLKNHLIKQGLDNVFIEVDGGVKVDNIQKIAEVGADILVSGSGLFDNFDENLQKMSDLIRQD
jgi:ribulose-phosphate 3-epimerase